MDIEDSEQEMKQEWSLLDPMVDLFEQIEEGVEFAEAANTPILRGESGQHRLPADHQNKRDGKIL